MASPQSITVDQMRQILGEVMDALESPDYASKLDEAKEAAGNEMLKMMQIVFPMFTQMVRDMETLDGEVARLHSQIRSYYLPPVSISSSVDTSLHYKLFFLFIIVLYTFYFLLGIGDYINSKSFDDSFDYPLNVDIKHLVKEELAGRKPGVAAINYYPYRFLTNSGKCSTVEKLDLFIVVKSALNNFGHRTAIRKTYGQESMLPGRIVKVLFFLGVGTSSDTQRKVQEEMAENKDIIQMDFMDTYFNNTIKTMMSFRWLFEHCPSADYYLFTDDDMYISVSNLLDYAESTILKTDSTENTTQDGHLFAGYVFKSGPHRVHTSKWRVSLEEYPWNKWPPYVTAGAYVISKKTMNVLYIASLFVKHFRFDDIYLGIVAKKVGIVPTHCDRFHFYNKPYDREGYRGVIASHGFDNHDQLVSVWNEQNSLR
ncbi:Glycosyltransferase [Operophtera brumata]|uniref:Hexosyltransferase n=1 Tax=Operophtera brumata TaxID=104452 RepID=A0A0L7L8F0_OPEBR|nr:Glycosyltransferase [Operophtera brumata]